MTEFVCAWCDVWCRIENNQYDDQGRKWPPLISLNNPIRPVGVVGEVYENALSIIFSHPPPPTIPLTPFREI
jgi:hypothetical protein